MNIDLPDFTDARMLRLKAEERLKEKQHKLENPILENDVQKLLHELQVHQVQLEMQNDELREAYATAEIALKKFTMLYDLAPMGYLTLESDGTIYELNFTAAEMLKDKRFALVNSNFKLFVSEESRSVFIEFLKNAFLTGSKESCKVTLGYDGNPLCLAYVEGVVIDGENRCLLSVVDITSFKE